MRHERLCEETSTVKLVVGMHAKYAINHLEYVTQSAMKEAQVIQRCSENGIEYPRLLVYYV